MNDVDPDRDDELDLPPAEAERDRRRDHDLRAAEREGMRTGLAKQFKQVLDAQLKRAREAEERAARRGGSNARAEGLAPRAPRGGHPPE